MKLRNRKIHPHRSITHRISLLTLLVGTIMASAAHAQIPPRPAEGDFLHDYAKVLEKPQIEKIKALQKRVFETERVPLVVVTIQRMAVYERSTPNIEEFARRWFDTWGIGSIAKNDGMLILISVGDRKGRIELGNAWGRRFDPYCQRVMDNKMVPEFKKGDYGNGILSGLESLAVMANAGPKSEPPKPGLSEQFQQTTQFLNQHNPLTERFGPLAPWLMMFAGFASLVAAIFLPNHRKSLVVTGFVLILLAVAFWLVIIVMAIFGRGRGGGSSSGGGFGGGFSGGGGASGSW